MAGGRYAENAKIEADILRDSWPPGQGGLGFWTIEIDWGKCCLGFKLPLKLTASILECEHSFFGVGHARIMHIVPNSPPFML
jgi:hypothetical protein